MLLYLNRNIFILLLLFALFSCKKEKTCSETNAPVSSPKRISSIKSTTNSETRELHFIYDYENRVSKVVRRLNNNDMYVDYQYLDGSVYIDRIGSEWEAQRLDSLGYPDTVYTSWSRYIVIDYIEPGIMSRVSQYNESNGNLYLATTYSFQGNELKEIIHETPSTGSVRKEAVKYSNGKLVQFGHFAVSYLGDCVSTIEVSDSTIQHSKNFEYSGDCGLISRLTETTVITNGDSTYTLYEFKYEDGVGEFPFLWQTNFYRLTGIPEFLAHSWNYGGI